MIKFKPGDVIEYLANVTYPASQEGKIGQTKTVDRDISVWSANYLLRGNVVRLFNPESPLQIVSDKKTKETKQKGNKKNHGQGKLNSKRH